MTKPPLASLCQAGENPGYLLATKNGFGIFGLLLRGRGDREPILSIFIQLWTMALRFHLYIFSYISTFVWLVREGKSKLLLYYKKIQKYIKINYVKVIIAQHIHDVLATNYQTEHKNN